MGMAASQARLLTITARMHDVEYKAQAIQNAKIQLATQSDQVYRDYIEALDATTLTVTDMNKQTVVANFNNLFGRKAVETGCKYALRDGNGRLLVPEDIKEGYDQFIDDGGSDPYDFALYMLLGDNGNSMHRERLEDDEYEVYSNHSNEKSDNVKSMNAIQEKMNKLLSDNGVDDYNDLDEDKMEEYEELELAFKAKLYKSFASEIYAKNYEDDEENFNQEDFNYYVSIFKQIQAAGGCESISDYDGPCGDASSDSDFLKNMLQCGKFSIDIVNEDKNGVVTLSGTSPESDTYLGYTTTSTIDKAALAKAEAKYEHDSKEINQKDKKFDMELSKLETERNALDTEYKSVQKVIQDNIERTFGIFS